VVDTEERRTRLIDATSEAIARDGLANITLRSIARSAGWTTGIVNHYFEDKRALLMATFLARADRARRQIDASVAAGRTPLDAVIATLPLDADGMLDWRVSIAFIGAAIGDEEMVRLHHARVDRFTQTVRDAIVEQQVAGTIDQRLDPDLEADRLVVVINGIAVQAVLRSNEFTSERQLALVDAHLDSLRPESTRRRRQT
jgi:TetR/AcrR family transcriptional repressor of bet genes